MSEDNALTFDSAQEEENVEQHEEGHTEHQPAEETTGVMVAESIEEASEDISTFLRAVPDSFLDEPTVDVPDRTPPGVRINIVSRLEALLDPQGISDQIDIISGDLSNLNQRELLLNIAQSNRLIATVVVNMAQTQINQLQALYEIVGAVEPFLGITVSGVNTVDDADEPVPVVPESDDTSIPTRLLMVKASDNNHNPIAFGDDEVSPNDGFILEPGENISLAVDLREMTWWMASTDEDAAVELLGVA